MFVCRQYNYIMPCLVVMMVVVVVYCAEWRYNNITVLNINYILSHTVKT